MTKLDQFKQDTKELKYEFLGKTYTANLTALSMLDAIAALKNTDGDEGSQIKGLLEAVFGKVQSKELLDNMSLEGINVLIEEIVKGLGLSIGEKRKA